MNIIRKSVAATAAFALSIGFALPAAAQTGLYGTINGTAQTAASAPGGVSGSASISADGSVSVGSGGTNASNSANVSGSGSVGGIVDTGLGARVKGVVNAIIGGPASSSNSGGGSSGGSAGSNTGSASGSGSTQGSATVSGTSGADIVTIVITRADVDGGATVSVSASPANVRTNADLGGFIAAQVQADKNVSQVEASADNVAVTYKQNAKLFGFIPITIDATATVDAGGNVNIKYPWYAFLASTNSAELEAKIQDRVDAVLGANVSGNASAQGTLAANAGKNGVVSGNASATGTAQANANAEAVAKLTAEAQAKLVAEIKAVMESELAADAEANVNAAANAGGNVNVQ